MSMLLCLECSHLGKEGGDWAVHIPKSFCVSWVLSPLESTFSWVGGAYVTSVETGPLKSLTTFAFFLERPPGYDRVRNAEIGNKDFELDVLEEAYTTEHWLVRIYKVSKQ